MVQLLIQPHSMLLHQQRRSTTQRGNNNNKQEATPPVRDTQITAQIAMREPTTGDIVYGQRALAAWKAHMQQHLSGDKHTTAAHYNDPVTEFDHQSTGHSSPTLSSGSSSSEAMHERRARTGPCEQALAASTSFDEDCQAPIAAAHAQPTASPQPTCDQVSNGKQQSLLQYFCAELQSGFDEEH